GVRSSSAHPWRTGRGDRLEVHERHAVPLFGSASPASVGSRRRRLHDYSKSQTCPFGLGLGLMESESIVELRLRKPRQFARISRAGTPPAVSPSGMSPLAARVSDAGTRSLTSAAAGFLDWSEQALGRKRTGIDRPGADTVANGGPWGAFLTHFDISARSFAVM